MDDSRGLLSGLSMPGAAYLGLLEWEMLPSGTWGCTPRSDTHSLTISRSPGSTISVRPTFYPRLGLLPKYCWSLCACKPTCIKSLLSPVSSYSASCMCLSRYPLPCHTKPCFQSGGCNHLPARLCKAIKIHGRSFVGWLGRDHLHPDGPGIEYCDGLLATIQARPRQSPVLGNGHRRVELR